MKEENWEVGFLSIERKDEEGESRNRAEYAGNEQGRRDNSENKKEAEKKCG